MDIINLSLVDWAIMIIYIAFVIGLGVYLKKFTKTDDDFFLAGRRNNAWVAGVAFMSANMGAMEVMGYSGMAVKYGLFTAHFYLVGAIPAMLFLGIFMMPFYYQSRIKSIPGYLKERFDEKTRLLNAFAFSIMMILVSGVALYALALVLHTFLGWNWDLCIWMSAALVAVYITLSGLMSAIFTEIIQFFLIWGAILLLPILGIIEIGGPSEILNNLSEQSTHLWATSGNPTQNAMMVTWAGLLLGLGFVVSFGYWTTDFLIIQRAFSAKDLRSAQLTPIIGSYFKLLLGVAVVGAGLVALNLLDNPDSNFALLQEGTKINYDSVMPMLMKRYLPTGLIGVGVTALVAMFMAGQAGNMSAFNTVWTYDIYRSIFNKNASSKELMNVGRIATVVGILLSVAAAYWAKSMPTIMDYFQAIISWINAPTIAVILLGMFVKKITPHGAFWGMLTGIVVSFALFMGMELGYLEPHAVTPTKVASYMAANFWRGFWAWLLATVVAIIISFFTKKKSEQELEGLVKGLTKDAVVKEEKMIRKPAFWAFITIIVFIIINILLW